MQNAAFARTFSRVIGNILRPCLAMHFLKALLLMKHSTLRSRTLLLAMASHHQEHLSRIPSRIFSFGRPLEMLCLRTCVQTPPQSADQVAFHQQNRSSRCQEIEMDPYFD
jgi:hypothetical protein